MNTSVLICIIIGSFITVQECLKLRNKELVRYRVKSDFTCDFKQQGLYADVENNCKLFYMCKLESDNETFHKVTFFCHDRTVFDQKTLQCTSPQQAFPCSQARSLFNVTANHFFLPDLNNATDTPQNNLTNGAISITESQNNITNSGSEITESSSNVTNSF